MEFQVRKAERKQKKLKANLAGPSGSGKTYTALEIATGIGEKILVVDSEAGSSDMYADKFDFDVIDLPDTKAETYIESLLYGHSKGYEVIIQDSLSHSWESLLDLKEEVSRQPGKAGFNAWSVITPIYNRLLRGIITAKTHVIGTMRVKTEYVMEDYTDDFGRTKQRPRKVGMAPLFRAGGEYEFDVVGNLDVEHYLTIEKTRIAFLDGKIYHKPGPELGREIKSWLDSGKVPLLPVEVPLSHPTDTHKTVGDLAVAGEAALTEYMIARKTAGDGTAEELAAGKELYTSITKAA